MHNEIIDDVKRIAQSLVAPHERLVNVGTR
jgi:hypothetical protein